MVGGGPAGLAAAAAIRKADPSLRVHVFEKTDMRARGAAVLVGANGLMALNAIDSSITNRLITQAITLEGAGEQQQQRRRWRWRQQSSSRGSDGNSSSSGSGGRGG